MVCCNDVRTYNQLTTKMPGCKFVYVYNPLSEGVTEADVNQMGKKQYILFSAIIFFCVKIELVRGLYKQPGNRGGSETGAGPQRHTQLKIGLTRFPWIVVFIFK